MTDLELNDKISRFIKSMDRGLKANLMMAKMLNETNITQIISEPMSEDYKSGYVFAHRQAWQGCWDLWERERVKADESQNSDLEEELIKARELILDMFRALEDSELLINESRETRFGYVDYHRMVGSIDDSLHCARDYLIKHKLIKREECSRS